MGFFKLSAVFLLAFLQWEVHSQDDLNCPPNSSPGVISLCERNCSNIAKPPVQFCFDIGIYTCKCDKGLVAQTGTSGESVQCVNEEDCKVPCGPNQHYEFCASGCQPTCKQPFGPRVCDKKCYRKCVCNKGYVLSGDTCVTLEECKRQ
ncbi:alpha-tectorin-like [Bufo bufo]|uniref:alpha-tectorin-like n=1 Tax=Bufo bufo TaxID=8384 RepID=UPI001ABDFF25|nr:alpha-tectorin-like [Bufo bufo]